MELSPLWSTYKRTGRKPATDPVTMLKVLLYANMEGIYSGRDIEKACARDMNFIWLLNGAKGPNYHEIARFRSKRLAECGEALFYELVKRLAVDGHGISLLCTAKMPQGWTHESAMKHLSAFEGVLFIEEALE